MQKHPLLTLHNRGNTCWAASAIQALRCLAAAPRMCKQTPSSVPLRKALCDADGVPDTVVPHLFLWARQCLKNQEGCGHRPADPAEWFVELCDRAQDANTQMFEAKRVQRYECLACGHVRHAENEEKVLILPCLPDGGAPVQSAMDAEFGYHRPAPPAPLASALPPTPPWAPPPTLQPGAPAGAPPVYPGGAPPLPLSYSEYGRGFHPQPAEGTGGSPSDETWWRCDDGQVAEVRVQTATPYLLFYEERGSAASAAEAEKESLGRGEATCQVLELDCDHGKCGGARRRHTAYVESYEMGSVLAVQIACPRLMRMDHVERTLYTGVCPDPHAPEAAEYRAYDLKSFVSRVGGYHYVAYVKRM